MRVARMPDLKLVQLNAKLERKLIWMDAVGTAVQV